MKLPQLQGGFRDDIVHEYSIEGRKSPYHPLLFLKIQFTKPRRAVKVDGLTFKVASV